MDVLRPGIEAALETPWVLEHLSRNRNEAFLRCAGMPGQWWREVSDIVPGQNLWRDALPLLKVLLGAGDAEQWLWTHTGQKVAKEEMLRRGWECPADIAPVEWLVGVEGMAARGGQQSVIEVAASVARQAVRKWRTEHS